ncbi:MAG: PAS domain S-box protein [Candidatus Marinimicrobia bacterium]|nr:PAS domain S-box protein [Candidatus Neomarinimicrobiota bacterium]MCF7850365.1 PAS domain S-box protein [Candidatus Neomarinimicrobiota bacterium]MCF7904490.1 PAS domain S-box protein [Candidatus Neomarinimicrobiota bacterium]
MLTLFSQILSAVSIGVITVLVTVLGERNKFNRQRGWYLIVVAWFLLWSGTLLKIGGDHIDALATPFIQDVIREAIGEIGGAILLMVGLLLWAPAIAASREKYLQKIKISERRYRILAEEATDMLAEHDSKGRFIYTTQRSKRIVGYEPEELKGKSIYEFVDPEELSEVQAEHQKILEAKEPRTFTYRFKHKDGRYIWLESATKFSQPEADGEDWKILSMSRDVSERIRYEKDLMALNESQELQQKRIRILYELAATTNIEADEQLEETVSAGAKTLGVDLGIISHIEGKKYTVLYFYPESSGLKKRQVFELEETYCSMTVDHGSVIAIDQMSTSEYAGHPCWDAFKLEAYIGVPIVVSGSVYGTLAFSSNNPRKDKFTESDKDLVRLMGQWVSRVLDRENANQALQQSQKRYKSVISSSVMGVILIDTKGFILSFNQAAEKIFDYQADEIIGKNVRVLMYGSEFAQSDELILQYLQKELPSFIGSSREVSARKKGGEEIFIELGISEIKTDDEHYFSGVVMDITARKKAEEDLANAHLRLQNIFSSATQVAIIATDLEGKMTTFNPGAENMLGYAADEVLGETTDMFHLDSEVIDWSKQISKGLGRDVTGFETFVSLAKLGGQEEHEWTYVRKDGSHLTVNSAVTALKDTNGEITGFLGIILDITQRKRGEEALKLAKSVAEEANRTKSEFLANMSHELRTPLNSVIGFSSILLNSLDDLEDRDHTYLERIHENGKHLLQLINDILDLSKIESGRIELELVELDIGEQIKDIVKMVESQVANKPIELSVDIPKTLAPNLIDPGKLKQVVLNLISNALKFTSEGSITVRLKSHKKSKRVSEIRVEDTGIGIPADRLESIFDEFTQVDSSTQRKFGGTGLGLSISQRLCRVMNCELSVESQEGKGSTFIISLPDDIASDLEGKAKPREQDATRQRNRVTNGTKPDTLAGRRILLIDDDVDSITLLKHYLSDTECTIDTANGVDEAQELMKANKPDLITLDLQMPEVSGETFLKRIREKKEYQDIPVVVVSIIAREQRGRIPGVVDFIPKPIQKQQLLWAIRRNISNGQRRILIVEDDTAMRLTLAKYAAGSGAEIRAAGSGEAALDIIKTLNPDLILLDLRMPGMDGHKFLDEIHAQDDQTEVRVIVVTGKDLSSEEAFYFKTEGIPVIVKNEHIEAEVKHAINKAFED